MASIYEVYTVMCAISMARTLSFYIVLEISPYYADIEFVSVMEDVLTLLHASGACTSARLYIHSSSVAISGDNGVGTCLGCSSWHDLVNVGTRTLMEILFFLQHIYQMHWETWGIAVIHFPCKRGNSLPQKYHHDTDINCKLNQVEICFLYRITLHMLHFVFKDYSLIIFEVRAWKR